ncbi:hypothetical protein N9V90_01970 [Endozoicomonas sp.]|nr:hypothetical protein [Endozoicomonas sp.]
MHRIKDKTVFITGGAGFIGSTLIGKFVEENKVISFDNLDYQGLRINLNYQIRI